MADKNEDENLIGPIDDELEGVEPKKGKTKKIIIISILSFLVIASLTVTLFLILKNSGKNQDYSDSEEKKDLKYDILMKESDFIMPQSNTKKIQLIQLKESKYKFILVHDPKTVNAGIEFRTNFGFNTEVLDGLAHYAEHVWFEGTKLSDEFEIFNLIIQYDEFLNAYTSNEETVFQLLGSNLTFNETLNLVSNFIKNPMLNESQFTIEVNAVNSEYDTYNY